MTARTRLELTWIGKDEERRIEPRILLEQPERSYRGKQHAGAGFENRLIQGDNLLALNLDFACGAADAVPRARIGA